MAPILRRVAEGTDERLQVATPLRRAINKVFPEHWSFLLGEIALYSFVLLLITGTFLALFFEPSPVETTYDGSYEPLRGTVVSGAFDSALRLSFDVRGGLLIRQMHHWAANLFMAAIVLHLLRIFFTGVFRKPRELNWLIGLSMFWLGFLEGFAGYSLPDDGLSGTGLRIGQSILLSVPVAGSWLALSLFGGEFPGTEILPRLYITHVFLIPGALVALITIHLALIVRQKHTQWHRPRHTAHNVVGNRMIPRFALSSTSLALAVFGVVALLGGLVQINPIWLYGSYRAAEVSSNSQPDWYVWFMEGALRLTPRFTVHIGGYTVPQAFWAGLLVPAAIALIAFAVPWIERARTRDGGRHELAQRPRDAPSRTAIGAMALTFWLVLSVAATDDTIALVFQLDLDAVVWVLRVAVLVLPPLAYVVVRRLALGLQHRDDTVLEEGIETGQLRMLPDGRFVEARQPLGEGLPYRGWLVPKRVNEVLGRENAAPKGFFVRLDRTGHRRAATADQDSQRPAQPN